MPGAQHLHCRINHVTGQRSVLNDLTDPSLGPTTVQAERGAIEFVPGGFNILLSLSVCQPVPGLSPEGLGGLAVPQIA